MSDSNPDPWEFYHYRGSEVPEVAPLLLRFAFYGRCSTDDNQDPETSYAWQLRSAKQWVDAVGGSVVAEFFDIGDSRSLPWRRRPEAAALLAELSSPDRRFDAIVVGEGQRCFYGTQFADLAPLFEHYGVDIHLPELQGRYNSENTTQDMLMAITGGMSKGERRRIQERVKQGMAAQVETTGRYQGGRPPYGYIAVPYKKHPNPKKASEGFMLKRLEVDPVAGPVVQRIFDELLSGKTYREIATGLNVDNVLCPSAHDPERNQHRLKDGWKSSAVRAILENPRYTGYEHWGKFRKQEELISPDDVQLGYQTRLVRSKEQLVRSHDQTHPALVDTAVFLAADKEIARRTRPIGHRIRKTYAFQSILRCSICSRKLEVRRNTANTVSYRCRGFRDVGDTRGKHATVTLSEQVALATIGGWLRELFDEDNLDDTIDQLTASDHEVESPLVTIQRQHAMTRLAEATKRKKNLIRLIANETLDEEDGIEELAMAKNEIKQAEAEIDSLTKDDGYENPIADRDEVRALVTSFVASFDELFGGELSEDIDSEGLQNFFHVIGLTSTYDKAQNSIYLEIQPNLTKKNRPDHEGRAERVRGGT